jgi:hypothetical protein
MVVADHAPGLELPPDPRHVSFWNEPVMVPLFKPFNWRRSP